MLSPIHIDCGLPVRKSRIQLQREVQRPRFCNFSIRIVGMMVLNAELQSMNSILIQVFVLSGWSKAVWRAIEIVSAIDLLRRQANCNGFRSLLNQEFRLVITNISKHFITVNVNATGRQSLRQLALFFLGTGIIGAFLKQVRTLVHSSERLKMPWNIPTSWLAQVFRAFPGTPSRPFCVHSL